MEACVPDYLLYSQFLVLSIISLFITINTIYLSWSFWPIVCIPEGFGERLYLITLLCSQMDTLLLDVCGCVWWWTGPLGTTLGVFLPGSCDAHLGPSPSPSALVDAGDRVDVLTAHRRHALRVPRVTSRWRHDAACRCFYLGGSWWGNLAPYAGRAFSAQVRMPPPPVSRPAWRWRTPIGHLGLHLHSTPCGMVGSLLSGVYRYSITGQATRLLTLYSGNHPSTPSPYTPIHFLVVWLVASAFFFIITALLWSTIWHLIT